MAKWETISTNNLYRDLEAKTARQRVSTGWLVRTIATTTPGPRSVAVSLSIVPDANYRWEMGPWKVLSAEQKSTEIIICDQTRTPHGWLIRLIYFLTSTKQVTVAHTFEHDIELLE